MEFSDVATAEAVLKQHDWEMDGRELRLDRVNSGGGGGGRSKFQRTYPVITVCCVFCFQVLIVTVNHILCRIAEIH